MVRSDRRVQRVLSVLSALLVRPARMEPTARSGPKVQWDLQVQPERMEPTARSDRRVRRVPQARMELMVRSDRRVQRVLSALLVRPARMELTAR